MWRLEFEFAAFMRVLSNPVVWVSAWNQSAENDIESHQDLDEKGFAPFGGVLLYLNMFLWSDVQNLFTQLKREESHESFEKDVSNDI